MDLPTQYISTDTTFKSLPCSKADTTKATASFYQDVKILFVTIPSAVVLDGVGVVPYIQLTERPYSKTQFWFQLGDMPWSNSVPIIPDSGSCTVTLFLIFLRVWPWLSMRWKSVRIHLQRGQRLVVTTGYLRACFMRNWPLTPTVLLLRRLPAFHLCFCVVF